MSKKSTISIIILIILVILGSWAFNISSKITRNVTANNEQDNEKASLEELLITETRNGQKFWEVYASSGQYAESKNGAQLMNIKGNFYKDNKVILSFDAPIATYIEKNKEIRLSGGTRAATDNGIFITSDEMQWTGNKDEINALGDVKIKKSNDFLITSDHAIFSTDFKKFKVLGNSKTNVYKKN